MRARGATLALLLTATIAVIRCDAAVPSCVSGVHVDTSEPCVCPTGCDSCAGEVCTRCLNTRFLAGGACFKNIECKGTSTWRKGVKMPDQCDCDAVGPGCHRCSLSHQNNEVAVVGTCLSCKKRFRLDGLCVKSCPEGLAEAGIQSQFGRKCLQPFTCKGKKSRDGPAERNGKRCKCPDKNCHICAFTASGASRSGEVCERCTNKQYLHGGTCLPGCPEGTVAEGTRKYGRFCKAKTTAPHLSTSFSTTDAATTTTTTTLATTRTTAASTTTEEAGTTSISCEGASDAHARLACQSCHDNVGLFYPIRDTASLEAVVRSPLGRQRIAWIMEDFPSQYFNGKEVQFGILLRPRRPDEEGDDGRVEQICLSMYAPELDVTSVASAVLKMMGLPLGDLAVLPPSFGASADQLLDLANPGDFNLPLKFAVDAPALPHEDGVGGGVVLTKGLDILRRAGSFLDTLLNPERGLFNLHLPVFTLNGVAYKDMYFKLFWLGIGFIPSPSLTLQNVGDWVAPGCCGGGKGPLSAAMDTVKDWPVIGEIVGLLMNAHLKYIAVRADNGARDPASLFAKAIGKANACSYSPRGGSSCPADAGEGDLEVNGRGGVKDEERETSIATYLKSYAPSRLTYDLHIDTQLTTPDDPLDLGKLFTGDDSAATIDNINLRFEIINLFNRQGVKRDYCARSGVEGVNATYDFEPPRDRASNFEIAASWSIGGVPLEVAFRMEQNARTQAVTSTRECKGTEVARLDKAAVRESQIGKNSWFIVIRFPKITIMQIICLAAGVDPGMSAEGDNVAPPGADTPCSRAVKAHLGLVPEPIINPVLNIGLAAAQKRYNAGRSGPLFAAQGAYQGPQITIQITGANPLDWIWQFQGTVTMFGVPVVPFDIKFGRGPYGAAAVQAGGDKAPVTQKPKTRARRRRGRDRGRRAVGGSGPSLLMGMEFGSQGLGAIIKQVVDAPFVNQAIDSLAGVGEGAVGFVMTSQDVSTAATPYMGLDLDVLRGLPFIPRGLTAILIMRMARPCANEFCSFITKHFGDPAIQLWANINMSPPGLAMGANLANIVIARDECTGAVGSIYELGRPIFELSSMGVFLVASAEGVTFGFRLFLTVDVGNIREGDGCAYQPVEGTPYKWLEPLTFLAEISVSPGQLTLAGAMIGIWTRALGLDVLHFGDLSLALGFTAVSGIPAVEAGGTLVLGRDCYVRDEVLGGLKENGDPDVHCVGGFANFGFSPVDPSQLYFAAGFKGMTLETIINVFAPASARQWLQEGLPTAVLESGFPQQLAPDGSIVPNPEFSYVASPFGTTTLTGRTFPGGLFFHGLVDLLGFRALADVIVNPSQQVLLNVSVSPLTIADVITLQRSSARPDLGPIVSVDVKYGLLSPVPSVDILIAGYVNLLGISAEAMLSVDNAGFHLFLQGRLFGLFMASLWVDAAYGNLAEAAFRVKAEMDGEFVTALNDKVQEVLAAAADTADEAIADALDAVSTAKAAVDAARARFDEASEQLRAAEAHRASLRAAVASFRADLATAQAREADASAAVATAAVAVVSANAGVQAAQVALNKRQGEAVAAEANLAAKRAALAAAQKAVAAQEKATDDAQLAHDNAARGYNAAVREENRLRVIYDDAAAAIAPLVTTRAAKRVLRDKTQTAFDKANRALADTVGECNDAENAVTEACTCARVCSPWGPCSCSNPLYSSCDDFRDVSDGLCGKLPGLRSARTAAQAALTNAADAAKAAEAAVDAQNKIVGATGAAWAASTKVTAAGRKALDEAKVVLQRAKSSLAASQNALSAAEAQEASAKRDAEVAANAVLQAETALAAARSTLAEAIAAQARVTASAAEASARVVALKTDLQAATALLETADAAVDKAAAAVERAQVVLDAPLLVLSQAKLALEAARQLVKAGVAAGQEIAKHGLTEVVVVTHALFNLELEAASGGVLEMQLTVAVLENQPERLTLRVDFRDLFDAALGLAEKAFGGIKDLF